MNEDPLVLARRLLNIFPAVRDAVTGASFISAGLFAALTVFQPLIQPKVSAYLQVYPPNPTNLFLLTVSAVACLSWLSHRFNRKARQQADFEKVVDVLERVMAKGQYTKIERKAVWRAIVDRLAQEAKLDARPPTANELQSAAVQELSDLASRS